MRHQNSQPLPPEEHFVKKNANQLSIASSSAALNRKPAVTPFSHLGEQKNKGHKRSNSSSSNQQNRSSYPNGNHQEKELKLKQKHPTFNPRNTYSTSLQSQSNSSPFQLHSSGIKLVFANNLRELRFVYDGIQSHTLNNYQLKIKNESPMRETVYIKIKSNSPSHYEVRPKSHILEYGQILSISIQLKLNKYDISPVLLKHDLSRYKNDKIKVTYVSLRGNDRRKAPSGQYHRSSSQNSRQNSSSQGGNQASGNRSSGGSFYVGQNIQPQLQESTDLSKMVREYKPSNFRTSADLRSNVSSNGQFSHSSSSNFRHHAAFEEGQRVFPVIVVESEEEKQRASTLIGAKGGITLGENGKLQVELQEMKVYEKKIEFNNHKTEEMQAKIKQQKQKSKDSYHKYLSSKVIASIGLMGMLLGFWVGNE